MKICPQCSKEFGEEYHFCPEDGTPLVQIVKKQDPLVGKTINEKYEITNMIREDNLGRTFQAKQIPLGRTVLLEIINATLTRDKKFHSKLNEAIRRYSKLQHVNIGTIYDMDETEDGRYFITSEYVEGRPLTDILREETPISQERVLNIFYQITDALQHAHSNMIHHGYLMPQDIIIYANPDGKECVQILNFGISKLLLQEKIKKYEESNDSEYLTVDDMAYLSPDQISTASRADDLDDIYSIGVIMYHALAGDLPYQADSAEAMIEAHTTLESVPVRNLPHCRMLHQSWDIIIEKCMKKKKSERFQNIKEIKTILQGISEFVSHEAEPTIMRMSSELGKELEKSRTETRPGDQKEEISEGEITIPPPPPGKIKTPPLAETFMIQRDEIFDAEEIDPETEETTPSGPVYQEPSEPPDEPEKAPEIHGDDLTEELPAPPPEPSEEGDLIQETVFIGDATHPAETPAEDVIEEAVTPSSEPGEAVMGEKTVVMEPALSPAEFPDTPETPADVDESEEEDISEGKTVYIEDISKPTKPSTDMDEVTLTEVIDTSESLDTEEDEEGGIFGQTIVLETPYEPILEDGTEEEKPTPAAETEEEVILDTDIPPPYPAEPPAPPVTAEEPTTAEEPVDLLADEPEPVLEIDQPAEEISPPAPPVPPAPDSTAPPTEAFPQKPYEYDVPPEKKKKKPLVLIFSIIAIVIVGMLAVTVYIVYNLLTPDKCELIVKSYPTNSAVYLNGDKYGSTPFHHENIDPGAYTLELRKEGYETLSKKITIDAGKLSTIRERLTRIGQEEPDPQPIPDDTELEEFLAKASDAFERKRYIEPEEDNAFHYAGKVLEIDPENDAALELSQEITSMWASKAEKALKSKSYYNAKKYYGQLIELAPDNEEFKQAYDDSEKKLQAYYQKKKQNTQQFQAQVERLMWQGDLITPGDENAYEICLQIRQIDRRNRFAPKKMKEIRVKADDQIDTAILEGKWERAQLLLEAFNKYFPGDSSTYQKLQKVKENLIASRQDQKLRDKENQRQLQLEKARQTSLQGIKEFKSGNYGNAATLLKEALKLDPNLSDAYFYLGAASLEMKDLRKAREYFNKAVQINPNHIMAHLNLGILSKASNDYDRAITSLNKVIALGGAPNYSVSRLRKTVDELKVLKDFNRLTNKSIAAEHKRFLRGATGHITFTTTRLRFETGESKKAFSFALKNIQKIKFLKASQIEFTVQGKKYTLAINNDNEYMDIKNILPKYLNITRK